MFKLRCLCECVCDSGVGVGVGVWLVARTAPRWSEGGCSVAACPGAGRARQRPTMPTMPLEKAAPNFPPANMVSLF